MNRIVTFDLRPGGPRDYEHGIVDLAIFAIEEGEVIHEQSWLLRPDPTRSYRPGQLSVYGLTYRDMEDNGQNADDAMGEFEDTLSRLTAGSFSFAFDATVKLGFANRHLRGLPGSPQLNKVCDVESMYWVSRVFGVEGPNLAGTRAVLSFAQLDGSEWESQKPLERAKLTAACVLKLSSSLADAIVNRSREAEADLLPGAILRR